jgi:photosystem II stability/assembly factor-like uncharacterized protein
MKIFLPLYLLVSILSPLCVSYAQVFKPTINIDGATTICEGEKAILHTQIPTGTILRWLRNGSPVENGTNTLLEVKQSGEYSVETTQRLEKWEWSMGGGQGNSLNDIQFVGSNYGWMVGDNGTLLKTTNGFTWDTIAIQRQEALSAVYFINTQTGWIGGEKGLLLKSTDGGISWTSQKVPITGRVQKIKFLNDNVGFTLGDRLLFKTVDGGANWLTVTLPNSFGLEDFTMIDADFGWIASKTQIYKTEDSGLTWALQYTVTTCNSNTLQKIYALNRTNCWAIYMTCSYTTAITRTNDGGKSWVDSPINIPAAFPTLSYLITNDLKFTDAQNGYVIGSMYKRQYASYGITSGAVFKTTDGGQSWGLLYDNPFDINPLAFSFRNTSQAVIVGGGGFMANFDTRSNIVSDFNINRTYINLTSIAVTNNFLGTVGGRYRSVDNFNHPNNKSVFLTSKTSGKPWIKDEKAGTFTPHQIKFKNELFGWQVGSGVLNTTNDGGITWVDLLRNTNRFTKYYRLIDKAYFQGDTTGWYISKDTESGSARLYSFSGGAQTLTDISYVDSGDPFPTSMLDLQFINDQLGFISTSNGKFIKTTNGGANWSVQVVKQGARLQRIFFVDERVGWIVGSGGLIVKTTNGGQSWVEQSSGTNVSLNGLHFLSDQVGYIVGAEGIVLKTTNGGSTWTRQRTGTRNTLNDINFINDSNGWIVGNNGTILKITIAESKSMSNTVTIKVNTAPEAKIASGGTPVVCEGTSLILNASAGDGNKYRWFKDEQEQTNASSSSLTVTSSGNYKVEVTNAAGCKAMSEPFQVQVRPLPNASFSLEGKNPFCAGTIVKLTAPSETGNSYTWYRDENLISGATNATVDLSQAGSYKVRVQNIHGCSQTSSALAVGVISQPAAVITTSGAIEFCEGGAVDLMANSGDKYTYQWFRDGNAVSDTKDIKASLSGIYTVLVKNSEGCERVSEARKVIVNPLPVFTLVVPVERSICGGKSLEFKVLGTTPASWYEWFRNGQQIANANSANLIIFESGTYEVRATNNAGCTRTSEKVVINPPYQISLITEGKTTFCEGENVKLSVQSTNSSLSGYQWYRNGTAIPGASISSYVATASGDYAIETVDVLGCKALSETKQIVAKALPAKPVITGTVALIMYSSSPSGNQWYRNGVAIAGATTDSYAPSQSGFYTVQVTQEGCTGPMSNAFEYIITATPPTVAAASVTLYPNPAGERLYVSLAGLSGAVQVELLNAAGQRVRSGEVPSASQQSVLPLELKGLPAGTYLVRVRSGTFTKTSPVILNP